ncbi:MAG: hypothetical protein ABIM31_00710 [candidate division WOR-3 bacterium]
MRKLYLIIVFLLFSASCAPRKVMHKKPAIEEIQENLTYIYNFFASEQRTAEFTILMGETQFKGTVSLTRRDSEWIFILKSPLYPGIYKILEDTIPVLGYIKDGIQKIPHRFVGSTLILDLPDGPINIEVENNLPVLVRFNRTLVIISYTKNKIPRTIKIQSENTTLLISLKI